MERTISGFHRDSMGDWVAELSCGHDQHVRHRPPFQERAWVESEQGRLERLGQPLECPLCDRAELPFAVRLVRSSPLWDERTMPRGLLRSHRLSVGTWGVLKVHEGDLGFSVLGDAPLSMVLHRDSPDWAIPPEVAHEVRPLGPVRFSIDFFAVARELAEDEEERRERVWSDEESGGDPVCWAHLLCPECGAVLSADPHRRGCSLDEGEPQEERRRLDSGTGLAGSDS